MDALDLALDGLAGEQLSNLPRAVLRHDLVELIRISARLHVEVSRRLAEFERRQEFQGEGRNPHRRGRGSARPARQATLTSGDLDGGGP
jgi:hypothetical protein